MHNLSFWQEPDWKRESTLNPNFLMAVIIALFIVTGIAMTTFAQRSKAASEHTLNQLKGQLQDIKTTADTLKEMQAETLLWQQHLETLKDDSTDTLFWSRQLEALQGLVPSEIRFSGLKIQAEKIRERLPADTKAGRPKPTILIKTIYQLDIQGEAIGNNPQAIITDFARAVANNSVIGDRLQFYEIQNITELRGEDLDKGLTGKAFDFTCTYKEME